MKFYPREIMIVSVTSKSSIKAIKTLSMKIKQMFPKFQNERSLCVYNLDTSDTKDLMQILKFPKFEKTKKIKKTKFEEYAAEKGIEKRKPEDKLVFSEEKNQWVRRYGKNGINEKKNKKQRIENKQKNERKMLRNIKNNKKNYKYNEKLFY